MVGITLLTALAAYGTAISVVLTVASIAYQQSQARKAKKAAAAAADKAKGLDVKTEFNSEPLPVVYGLNKVGGNVVWGALSDNYTHTEVEISGLGLEDFTNVASSGQLWEVLFGPNKVSEGAILAFNDRILRRTSAEPSEVPSKTTFLFGGSLIIGTGGSALLEVVHGLAEPLFAPSRFPTLLNTLGLLTTTGLRKSSTPVFFLSTTANINYTHTTLTKNLTGKRKEFLFVQQAIAVGGINRVITAEVDGKDVNDEVFQHGQRIDVCTDTSTAVNPMVGANFPLPVLANGARGSAFFTNIAHASMCFRLNRDEPQYATVPRVSFVVEGQRVRDIVLVGGVATFTTTRVYTDNPSLILADYLTNSTYGRGLADNQLDLASFYNAKEVAGTVISSNVKYTGYAALARGAVSVEETIEGSATLYSCNVVLDTDRNVWDNVQTILDTMNDPSLIWSEGQYKLQLDFPQSQAAQDSLVVAEFTESDVLNESVSITYPSQDDKLNQCTVRFRNANKRFSDDSVTFPKRGSSVLTTYLQEDNGVELKTDLFLGGVVDPYHASHIAEQTVRESRFAAVVEFTVGKRAVQFEPGDLVRLNLPQLGINQVVRLLETEVEEGLATRFRAKFFDFAALAWNVDPDQPGLSVPPPTSYTPPPSDVVFTLGASSTATSFNSGVLTWDSNLGADFEFVVQLQKAGDDAWRDLVVTQATSLDVPLLSGGVYLFSVQTRSTINNKSSIRVIAELNLDNIPQPANAFISQQPYNLRFIWQPNSDNRIKGYALYRALPIGPSTFIGRSDSNFFDWPVRSDCSLCIAGETKAVYVVGEDFEGNQTAPSIISYSIQPPSIQALESRFDQNEVVLSWRDGTNQFAVERYRIEGVSLDNGEILADEFVYSSSYRQVAGWLGASEWTVTPIDTAGNEGLPEITTAIVSSPSITNLTATFTQNEIVLSWENAVTQLPVDRYRVRAPSLGVDTFVYSSSYRQVAVWEGTVQWQVSAIDVAGNEGVAQTVDAEVFLPSIKNLTARIVQSELILDWENDATQLPIDRYRVRATSLDVDTFVYASSYKQAINWGGLVDWEVTPVDVAGNEGFTSVVTAEVVLPSVKDLSFVIDQNEIVLSWQDDVTQLPIDRYLIEAPFIGLSTFVYSSNYRQIAKWEGQIEWKVTPVDAVGNFGVTLVSQINLDNARIKNLSFEFDQNEIVLSWENDVSPLSVTSYRVQSPELGVDEFVYASSYRQIARGSGPQTWVVTPIDIAGRAGVSLEITATILPPSEVIDLASRTIINNTLLNWAAPSTNSLKIDRYEVRLGANPLEATSIGFYAGTFATLFEETAGEYQYWVAAIDTAGNYGPFVSTTTVVTSPRGFAFLRADSLALPDPNVVPINRIETWEQHFINNGFTTLQTQIDAGFPVYIQPTIASEEFTYFIDLGAIASGFQLQAIIDKLAFGTGNAIAEVFFSIRDSEADPWTELPEGRTLFADSARFIRLRFKFSSLDNLQLSQISGLDFRALVQQKDDAGTAEVFSSDTEGTTILFKAEFIDVESITVTVKNATIPLIPVYIFEDLKFPTSFKVKVFDINGNRQNATVGWSANGV
jgi:hypothetical protein